MLAGAAALGVVALVVSGCAGSAGLVAPASRPNTVTLEPAASPLPPRRVPASDCKAVGEVYRRAGFLNGRWWRGACVKPGSQLVIELRRDALHTFTRPVSDNPKVLAVHQVHFGERVLRIVAVAEKPGLAALSAGSRSLDPDGGPPDYEWGISVRVQAS